MDRCGVFFYHRATAVAGVISGVKVLKRDVNLGRKCALTEIGILVL
ncbi:MAG: hypothetical protein XD68_0413 [Synergistales bacterium 54_24]|nr:MAG: hypothetical protein XD68_0413 [Synergistales bacterium 54_24]MDI3499089.1 hypothetical protein [Synergistaceae bacterium]